MIERTIFAKLWVSGFFILTCLAFLNTGHAAIPPAEQMLPPDTLFVVSAPDFIKLRVVLEKIPLVQCWNDPAMKPFRDKFMVHWKEEFIQRLEHDLGVKVDDFAEIPRGQFTLALTKEDWNAQDGNPPGSLLLLDTKERSGQLKTNLAGLYKKWLDAGKALKTEKIRGADFSVIPISSNTIPQTLKQFFPQRQEIQELGKEPPKEIQLQLVIGQHESLLIVANSVKVADKVMARLTGGGTACLAEDAGFEANRVAHIRDAPFYVWFNAKVFFDVLAKVPEEKINPQAPSPIPMFQTSKVVLGTGMAALKSSSFTLRDAPDGTMFEMIFDTPEASRKGLFKLMALDAKDSGPPPFVPADAVKFQRVRLDGQKFTATFEKMLKDISPQLFNSYDFLVSNGNEGVKVQFPEYDLRRDLFGNLGDDFITYEKAPRNNTPAELDAPPTLYLLSSANPDKLLASLKGVLIILSSQANTPRSRDFLGRKIYTISLPPVQVDYTNRLVQFDLHYSASGGYVALSTDTLILEEFLRSSENSAKAMREVPGLADAAQKVGGQSTGWFGYENYNETMRVNFDMLRQNFAPQPNKNSLADSMALNPITSNIPYSGPEKSLRDWMDFSTLPSFDKVAKYFSFTVYSGSTTVDGITLKYFYPTPATLKQQAAK